MNNAGATGFRLSSTSGHGLSVSILEDDADLREQLVDSLTSWGFAATAWGSAADLYLGLAAAGGVSDLLVLDLGLPGESGTKVLRRLRAHEVNQVMGVVVLTGEAGPEIRAGTLLDGADAYLVKPVSAEVLAATLLSVQRRSAPAASAQSQAPWALASDDWLLRTPNNGTVPLTAPERDLLRFLSAASGTIFSRPQIIQAMGHKADYYLDHRLNMMVSRLRAKVREHCGMDLPLITVRQRGLMWQPRD